ncbi:hypothetical protein KY363_01360 [Candidatus Woesearchaeota archaeon]|nr:hypothetical protein [Candidatus Woesearchaeota archaeon]
MESSKSCMNYIVILVTILVLISGSASALKEEFSAFGSSETIDVCACDLKTDSLSIHNSGDVTSTYMLMWSGTAAKWTDLAPQTFYLEQNEVKNIDRFIKVPCSARGEYTLNTTIRTIFDTVQVLEQKVNVQNCPNVQIIPKLSDSQSVCPCTPVQYNFDVINSGNHIEIYDISVEPYSQAISLSTDLLILEPGEKHEVSVFINLACGIYGEQEYTFNAKAQGTGMLGQTDFYIDIQKCYEYNVSISDTYGVCQGVENVIPFQIENAADIANEYTISIEGADWTSVENITLSAWGGETVDSSILLTPPNEPETSYEVTLKATSTRGEETVEKKITLETEKCYDYQLLESDGFFDAIECEQSTNYLTLKNIGSRDTTYYFDLEGLEWLTADKEYFTVPAGESETITISGDVPCDTSGAYLENTYVTIDKINQTYLEEKTFNVYSKQDAYLPVIELTDLKIEYDGGETEVRVTNAGYSRATYEFSLTASDWITLNKTILTLDVNETGSIGILAYPTEETFEDIYAGELVAKVSGEDVEYATDFYVDLKENQGMPLWLIILIISGAVLLLAVIIVVLVLIFGKKKKTDKKEEKYDDKKKSKKDDITIDKREYRREKDDKKKGGSVWPWILLIALLLIIGGAAYYIITQTSLLSSDSGLNETSESTETTETATETAAETITPEETSTGVLTNQDIQESLITIDRSAVPGSGNLLEVTDGTEITLPMTIKNPTDRKAKFTVNTTEDSWITFDNKIVTVMPNATSTVNIKITPDMTVLENNDYQITINTTLEGAKIYYEESVDIVLSKEKSRAYQYWPWLIGGLLALALIIILLSLLSSRKDKGPAIKTTKEKKQKPEKIKEKPSETKKKGSRWWILLLVILGLIVLAAASILVYNSLSADKPTNTEETTTADTTTTTAADTTSETTVTDTTEPKLTNEDISESLITIDRSGVPGSGNILEIEQANYTLPLTIKNPTDRKAKFTVNTSNESWIQLDQYIILVMPNSTNTVNMNIIPDMEELKTKDYTVTINTRLEGQKIDYQEELEFELKQKRPFEFNYWWYVLLGIIILAVIIIIAKLAGRKEKTSKTEKAEKAPATKKSAKKDTKKKDKELSDVNSDIKDLRKKTVLKVKKGKY